jgi:adenosylcobinamide-GDP ribazoletransferase
MDAEPCGNWSEAALMIDPIRRISFAVALARAVRFFSRLPVPLLAEESSADDKSDFSATAIAVPIAGVIIGAVPTLTLGLCYGLGLGAAAAVVAALTAMVIVTGALHEDGMADVADGFFGAGSAERRLEIMRDSRHGSYGVLALILVMLARFALLTEITAVSTSAAAAALIAAASLSRAGCLMPLALLPPARRDGLGAGAGRLPMEAFTQAALLGCGVTLVMALIGHFGLLRGILACAAGLAACYGACSLAKAKIGGQTGDVAGCAQLLAELAVYVALAIGRGGA